MYDILITAAEKDFNKLKFVYQSIRDNIGGFGNVYCITDVPVKSKLLGICYATDDEIINLDFTKIKEESRRGWYRQQFIKLFQDVTWDDYLVIDADVWINKKMDIDESNPVFFLGRDQHHIPYFKLMKNVANLDRVYPHSFICEMMFFKRYLIGYMLDELKMTQSVFFDRCVEEINKNGHPSGFSEYEFYGNYVTKRWPDMYQYKEINVLHNAKQRTWTDGEVYEQIKMYQNSMYDLLTLHSWL